MKLYTTRIAQTLTCNENGNFKQSFTRVISEDLLSPLIASSISDRLSQTKEVIGRRLSVLKENTARAFGISHNEKDFHHLQQMQLRRASFLGGQTRVGATL